MPRTKASHCVLFIGSRVDEHAALRRIFGGSQWSFQGSFTVRDGLDLIRRNHQGIRVVICEQCLADGDWKCVLAGLGNAPIRANLIVSSRLADARLWAEVLNLGAFDLILGEPFRPEEVLRVTESAWRNSASTVAHQHKLEPQLLARAHSEAL
jgi:DNA-binding NtrC family response regulator